MNHWVGVSPAGRWMMVAMAAVTVLGAGCATQGANHRSSPQQAIQAVQEIPLEKLLDVGITVFDPGLEYPGTILLVTHDRYLIDALATQIWQVNPDESALTVFKGTYSQMKEEREKEAARLAAIAEAETAKKNKRPSRSPGERAERRRLAQLQELENHIAALERQLAELSIKLENPPADPAKVAKLGKEYASVQREMDEKLDEWEGLQD